MTEIVKQEFTGNGTLKISVEYEFKLSDFVVANLPSSCYSCPSGFSTIPGHPCGRNVPFKPEDAYSRPSTCKLRTYEGYVARAKLLNLV